MKPVAVGLIGLGFHAREVHVPALDLAGEFRLAAVATSREETAREAAARYRVAAYTGFEELLRRADVEAVIVAASTRLHDAIVAAALRQGRHVLVETPGLADPETARANAELARTGNLVVQVGYSFRHAPPVDLLKDRLEAQKPPRLAVYEYFPYLGHIHNLALYLSGPVTQVLAATVDGAGRTATLRHANRDTSVVIGRSLANPSVDIESIRISTGDFYAAIEGRRRVRVIEKMVATPVEAWDVARAGGESYEPQPFAARVLEQSGYLPQLRAFARAIRRGEPPRTTLDDAIQTHELSRQIAEAAKKAS